MSLHVQTPSIFFNLNNVHVETENDAFLDLLIKVIPHFGFGAIRIVDANIRASNDDHQWMSKPAVFLLLTMIALPVSFSLVKVGADLIIYGSLETEIVVATFGVLTSNEYNHPLLILFHVAHIHPRLDLLFYAVLVRIIILATTK